jgi:hypothetical protein
VKKISDEAAACIMSVIWLVFYSIACLRNTPLSWVICGFVTIVLLIICYYDWKQESANKAAKRQHELFKQQASERLKDVYRYDEIRKRAAQNDK